MTSEEMRELCRRIYQEVFERGNMDTFDELIAEDYIDISPDVPTDEALRGREGLRSGITALRQGFPDLRVRIHELIADGDTGVARVTYEGTHTGDFMGTAPTNKEASWDTIDIVHVREGQVRERYGLADTRALTDLLGPTSSAG